MPFDEEEEQPLTPNKGLKSVSNTKSIFENVPKKPTQRQLEQSARNVEQRILSYKERSYEVLNRYSKIISDKTIPENKTIFISKAQEEVLFEMLRLADEMNADPNEPEGRGSLTWISLLLKQSFDVKDRMNQMEYVISKQEEIINTLKLEIKNLKNE